MSIITLSEIRQSLRYYAGHRVTRGIAYAASASLIATAAIGIPQFVDAHATQTERVATAHRLIDGQLDATATIRSELVDQITAAEKVAAQAGKEGALPEKYSLADLRDAIAGAEAQLEALDAQATVTKKADAMEDSDSWLPHVIGAQADNLGEAFNDLRVETVTAGKISLDVITGTVRAEIDEKAAADKKAADEKAAEAAAALAAEEAAAAEGAAQSAYAPSAEPQQQTPNPGQATGGSCRAQAEALVAALSGAPVIWVDLYGARGMTGGGQVTLGDAAAGVALSSGTDDAFWCTGHGQYVAAHEAAHAVHNAHLYRLMDAGYRFDWQLARAEQAGDCIAHQWGYTAGATYGCDAGGQELARLILG
ncbi:hypothetical protein [Leucobacter chromiireducens]|uniref:Uncharacterized protein n=1 Tax=Leucobacter chromiireducens subsp. solipictus TaxID=398235 RepID=A0ABS1SJR9_9MICO|nr:hypothetical protein [Leucobacter chromiireducens]MBL3679533.1 hypothetical protein [Leucobacter chromiireducens subsp. solipictus]